MIFWVSVNIPAIMLPIFFLPSGFIGPVATLHQPSPLFNFFLSLISVERDEYWINGQLLSPLRLIRWDAAWKGTGRVGQKAEVSELSHGYLMERV